MAWADHNYGYDMAIGLLSNFVAAGVIALLAWFKPQWTRRILRKINWRLSGDLYWLACDLHSIKLQAGLGRISEMRSAIEHALGHAKNLGMKRDVISKIEILRDKYRNTVALPQHEVSQVREESDAIIDYVGKLAELGQPDYEP